VELPLPLTRLSKAERRDRAETALRVMGLAERVPHMVDIYDRGARSDWNVYALVRPRAQLEISPPRGASGGLTYS
jgi:hypothetical protein